MALLISSSRDGDSLKLAPETIPPLFAGPLRDDLLSRVASALDAGDHENATALLKEADNAFPGDTVFPAFHLRCLKLAERKADCEKALQEAMEELKEDCFVASLGRFCEALSLSRGHRMLEERTGESFIAAAYSVLGTHWRFAETLLHELAGLAGESVVPSAIWGTIERQKREDSIRVALEESGRAEHIEYLPHLRDRLARLAKTDPENEGLESRLRELDGLLAQRVAEERDKNLRRLTLFRDRLDFSDNPRTLREFRDLVSPFVDPYPGDPAFLSVLEEIRKLHLTYADAARFVTENRLQEALQLCDQVLQKRPSNVLFSALEEKAKVREWVGRLVSSAVQRARAFEEAGQYAEALDEWEASREIDPDYPGLDSEILHCAALKQQAARLGSTHHTTLLDQTAFTPEIVEQEPEYEPPPVFVACSQPETHPTRLRIAITEEAWDHLKTGLAATAALLLVVLVIASRSSR